MRRTLALTAVLLLSAMTLAVTDQALTAQAKPAATAHTATANDASKRAKVEELLVVTKTTSLSETMLANVPTRVRALASRQPIVTAATSPEQKKLADDYLQQMSAIAATVPSWASLKPRVIDLYLAAYTEADLDGILAFFKSPAGQAYVAKSPELSQKTVEMLQGSVNALAPQFEAATRAFQTSMQNTSPAGSTDSTPARTPASGPPTLLPRK